MKQAWFSLYLLSLALWTGGMALFTFIVTPAIFRSYGRDMAGQIVGTLFPGYFAYNLAISAAALVLFFLAAQGRATLLYRLSLFLLTAAIIANAYISYRLYPAAQQVKQQVSSFEREAPDSPLRKQFRRLHGVSAILNLLLLADGTALLIIAPHLNKLLKN
jgi:uncharacterized membrane protein